MTEYAALLERLEKENRRLKALSVIILTLLPIVLVTAQSPTARTDGRVEGREFVLLNQNNRARAVLSVAKDWPTLSFISPESGDLALVIGVLPEGPVLGVVQPDGTWRNYPIKTLVAGAN